MTPTQRATRRTLTILGTLWLNQGIEVILTTAPTPALLALAELPAAIGAAAAIRNLWRALG